MQLCRDVYHCLPSQLDQEDGATIEFHLQMMAVEQEVEDHKRGKRGRRVKSKRNVKATNGRSQHD